MRIYRGVTNAADCGVALVDALDHAASAPPANDEIVSVGKATIQPTAQP